MSLKKTMIVQISLFYHIFYLVLNCYSSHLCFYISRLYVLRVAALLLYICTCIYHVPFMYMTCRSYFLLIVSLYQYMYNEHQNLKIQTCFCSFLHKSVHKSLGFLFLQHNKVPKYVQSLG